MQFIKNGPDVPNRLINAHEDGRVVFFCGAGISYPAGLPGFKGLAEKLCEAFDINDSPTINSALRDRQYDRAIGLLEQEIQGKRVKVRNQLAELLTPEPVGSNATKTHEALLQLSRCRNGKFHLVTTNFDRLFETACEKIKLSPPRYFAPLIQTPKQDFSGLTYLHGILPEPSDEEQLHKLVITSGDFGLAYLKDRWAAKFVSELFQRFVVCFVGYSINDPVMRYMIDAIAVDREAGESTPEAFIFRSYSKEEYDKEHNYWMSRNVTPILYKMHAKHLYLRHTLEKWASMYQQGALGKEGTIVRYAPLNPITNAKEDDFVGRVLWALNDSTGIPAGRFAKLQPPPFFEWLDFIASAETVSTEAQLSEVTSKNDREKQLKTSENSPLPLARIRRTLIHTEGQGSQEIDPVMHEMGRWLSNYLDDPRLAIWVAEMGGRLHFNFAFFVREALKERDLSAPVRALWRIILGESLKSPSDYFERSPLTWYEEFKKSGFTTTSRFHLRELLTPSVQIRKRIRWWTDESAEAPIPPERVGDLVEWEIELKAEHFQLELDKLRDDSAWKDVLVEFLPDLAGLLRDTMDLMRELGGVNEKWDISYSDLPSVSDHPQNERVDDWAVLIVLTRDAWLAVLEKSSEQARHVFEGWHYIKYPVFRRLEFFALANSVILTPHDSLNILLQDDCWWLWSTMTQRETMRLILSLSPKLNRRDLSKLQREILKGPPRDMFKPQVEAEDFNSICNSKIWLRLAKLDSTGVALSKSAQWKLEILRSEHPKLQLSDEEREEFPSWTSDGSEYTCTVRTPESLPELVQYLIKNPKFDHWDKEDDWEGRCRTNLTVCADALKLVAEEGHWPTDRWRVALFVWSEGEEKSISWQTVSEILVEYIDQIEEGMTWSLSTWLEVLAKDPVDNDERFFRLIGRVLDIHISDTYENVNRDSLNAAINHPVGKVTESLFKWWFRRDLRDGQGIETRILPFFNYICDLSHTGLRHGRVILGNRLLTLFRVDEEWTKDHLIPLFDWNNSEEEAIAVWDGFLWSPRLYIPLFEVLKPSFLASSNHYNELGVSREHYANLLAYAALDLPELFSKAEMREAFSVVPEKALEHAANSVYQALDGSGDQRDTYWKKRVRPFLKNIWPQRQRKMTDRLSMSLALVCIAAGSNFSEALSLLKPWLQPIDFPDHVLRAISDTEICTQFPKEALEFIGTILNGKQWIPRHLKEIVTKILEAQPDLNTDPVYLQIEEYIRSRPDY